MSYRDDGAEGIKLHWNNTTLVLTIILLLLFVIVVCCCIYCPKDGETAGNAVGSSAPASLPTTASQRNATVRLPATASPNNVRLNPEILASLPTFLHSATDSKGKVECPVCLTELKEGDEVRFLPRCFHRFHAECIDLWFLSHSTCPICRTIVEIQMNEANL